MSLFSLQCLKQTAYVVGFRDSTTSKYLETFCSIMCIVCFRKKKLLAPQKGLEFPGDGRVGGICKTTKLCVKLNWNFQRGGGLRKKKSFP